MGADIDEDPRAPLTSTLAELVGAIVIYYAVIEHWLDGMVFCIHDRVPGAKAIEKLHPFRTAQEPKFLRDCFNDLPDLIPFKDEGLALLDKLEPMSEFRHNVVHGHIRAYNFDEGWLEFSRKVKGPNHAPMRSTMRIDINELFRRSRGLLAIIPAAQDLTHRLVAQFAPEYNQQQAAGSLGWTLPAIFPFVKKIGD